MFKKFAVAGTAAIFLALPAQAAPIYNVSVFDYGAWADEAGRASAVETFEQSNDGDSFRFEGGTGRTITDGSQYDGDAYGELDRNGYRSSQVGQFTALSGAVGGGSTCRAFDLGARGCTGVSLQYDPDINGQGSVVSDFAGDRGAWALNSSDTNGMNWAASLTGGGLFDRLFFILRDAADAGRKKLDITTEISVNGSLVDSSYLDERLRNNNRLLVMIDLPEPINFANVSIQTSRNDAFTVDGAGLGMSAIPLPASAVLLLAGLGGLAVLRRRKKA